MGFGLALALAGCALAVYLLAEDIARRAPAGADALGKYVALIDAQRERVEARLGPWRDQATSAIFPEG